jgi:sigma-E factor negative regulatory protein RseA
MNEKLSALMDGELDRDTAVLAIKTLGGNDEQRKDWDCYHLIGDALRNDMRTDSIQAVVRRQTTTNAIFTKLAEEPTVLAPVAIRGAGAVKSSSRIAKAIPVQQRTRFALAMAASVVTVSAIGVVAFKQQQTTAALSNQVAQQTLPRSAAGVVTAVAAANATAPEARVNDYLLVHRQFANPAALQAAALKRNERIEKLDRVEQRQAVGQ